MESYNRINLAFLETFTNNDKAKMIKYINMFLQLAPASIETMKQQHAAGDWNNLKTTAHSLKPQLAYMGIESLRENVIRIEEYAGEQKNPDSIAQLISLVDTGCTEAFAELQDVIGKIA
ncbi:MAG TPA: Hpt domain-containing protein [Ferruginibacter sp.]|nr:Hpt domain-containing protein [Chitinophagales bacterium]HNL66123.1 Hpt domain-containing protein [Ferruginibacter sp.]HNA58441.1 Hpt domain-containing protein [Chitinophagales bacterium]HNE47215.1 Hpt domain-containing protein [Chitinophagales bacterium]HNF70496.1 Hpt domain-containing protein [Chitinophagales bacterium]